MAAPRTSLARGGPKLARLRELCGARLDSVTFRRLLRPELGRLLPFEAYCVSTVDPESLLVTSSIGDGLAPRAAARLLELEEAGGDFNRLASLARGPGHVATLSLTTRGEVNESARFRELFRPLGLRDELRAALVVDGLCWGYLHLFRCRSFEPADVRAVELARPLLAAALRASCLVGGAPRRPEAPAVLLFDARSRLVRQSSNAKEWLESLDSDVGGASPHLLLAAVERARRGVLARGRYRSPRGDWLCASASALGDETALSLTTPLARELAPLWFSAHRLSARERELAELLLDGHENHAIAARLGIRPYTVKDHVKAILAKTGAPSRGALLAALCV